MANYVKNTNFAVKDSLLTGNPSKLVKGTEIDTEFNAIASAIATKVDTTVSSLTLTNLTTDNLIVGNQTNKATVVYTTNAARTLTVPAVAGNRTFAFIDEAQTFSANQTIGADLTFSGNGRKLVGLFEPAHDGPNGFRAQNSASNRGTALSLIPNGTNKSSAFIAYSSSTDPANSNYIIMYGDDTQTKINSDSAGTGTTQRLRFDTDDIERLTIAANGSLSINTNTNSNYSLTIAANGRTHSLQADNRVKFNDAYSYTVGATNRTLYIDNTGEIGGLSSTRKSKINITPIADADWLMSLEPVSYNRRERDANGVYTDQYNPTTEFGLIADDVVSVKPELCIMVDGKVSGINYEQLISPMLKEIQKLRAEVNALKEKVNG